MANTTFTDGTTKVVSAWLNDINDMFYTLFAGATTAAAARTAIGAGTGNGTMSNVVEDTTPQLGGDLDINGKFINGNLTSDTDSTDDIGTTSVRWANVYTDSIGDSGQVLDVDSSSLRLTDGVIFIKEQAEADADQAGYGQVWVDTATPNKLMFTDDAGTDFDLTSGITLGTEQASTSGTSIDFTSIPAGTKKITVMFVGVSTNGTSPLMLQLGDAGGIETSGYLGSVFAYGGGASSTYAAGFELGANNVAGNLVHGHVTLYLEDSTGFTWTEGHTLSASQAADGWMGAGSKALSAELDRLRITTIGGSDTFDAGAINISYE